jgi:hypothetical protein
VDATWLFLSLIPSGLGFAVFVYGKKQHSWPHLIAGLGLLVYPYFTDSVTALVGVGVAILAALWLASRMGW